MENIIQIMNMIASNDSDDYNLACEIIISSIANGEMYEWEIIYLLEYSFDIDKIIGRILLNNLAKYDVVSQSGKIYIYADNDMRNSILLRMNLKIIDGIDIINDNKNNPWWIIDNELNPTVVDIIKSFGFDNILLKLH